MDNDKQPPFEPGALVIGIAIGVVIEDLALGVAVGIGLGLLIPHLPPLTRQKDTPNT